MDIIHFLSSASQQGVGTSAFNWIFVTREILKAVFSKKNTKTVVCSPSVVRRGRTKPETLHKYKYRYINNGSTFS